MDFLFTSGQCHTLDRVNENSTLRHAYDAQLCTDSVRRLALTKDPAFPVPTDKLVFLMVDPHSPVCTSLSAPHLQRFFTQSTHTPKQKHDQKYYELDASLPLRQALAGTHILENPQILVVTPEDAARYPRTPLAPAPLAPPPPSTAQDSTP